MESVWPFLSATGPLELKLKFQGVDACVRMHVCACVRVCACACVCVCV